MATKKSTAKKTTTKSAAKPVAKKTTAKKVAKPATKKSTTVVEKVAPKTSNSKKPIDIYNTNVSVLLAMAIEALILLLAYEIIVSAM